MNFAGRLKISSYASMGVIFAMIPILAWSYADTQRLTTDDYLVDEIQLKAYERTTFSDDYLLHQTERAKKQWAAATGNIRSLLQKAASELTDRREKHVLAEMQRHFDDTTNIFNRILSDSDEDASTPERHFLDSELGKRLTSQLVLRSSSFQAATYRLQKLTEKHLEFANNRSLVILSLFVILVAVTTIVNVFFLNRTMRLRLRTLATGARTIAGGDLNFRITSCGSDEFGDLAGTINAMTEMVQKYTRELAESEQKFRALVMNAPFIVTSVDRNGIIGFSNTRTEGSGPDTVIGTSAFDYVAPCGRESYRAALEKAFESQLPQLIVVQGYGSNDTVTWLETILGPIVTDGTVTAVIQVSIDCTQRKEAEEALERYARRLIMMEEDLRRKIASELHDDIGQAIAALSMNLVLIDSGLRDEAAGNVRLPLQNSQLLIKEIGKAVRNIMVELRPSLLDDFGLAEAVRSHVDQFEQRAGIAVTTRIEPFPRLPEKKEIVLFRIIQEALHNIAKHASATNVAITLKRTEQSVLLSISDDGRGFVAEDVTRLTNGVGWGLTLMRERAEMIGGEFRLLTTPGKGTTIIVELTESDDV